jgi:hypothetical protein
VLTPPDTSELQFHMRQSQAFTGQEALYAEDSLQRATDLMEVAIDVPEDPEDELAYRIMTTGILSMAHAIYVVSGEDSTALYAPFQSERLGSYSYSKLAQSVSDRAATGIPGFDQAVRYFQTLATANGADTSPFGVTSEHVFAEPMGAAAAQLRYRSKQTGPVTIDEIDPDTPIPPETWPT